MADLIDVDDVLTHSQLDDYLGGRLTAQMHLAPTGDASTVKARTWALDEVLAVLAARTPPIFEADITDESELRRAVTHKAAERLYDHAMTTGGDAELFHAKMKAERERARDALAQTRVTVDDGVSAPPMSIGISRR